MKSTTFFVSFLLDSAPGLLRRDHSERKILLYSYIVCFCIVIIIPFFSSLSRSLSILPYSREKNEISSVREKWTVLFKLFIVSRTNPYKYIYTHFFPSRLWQLFLWCLSCSNGLLDKVTFTYNFLHYSFLSSSSLLLFYNFRKVVYCSVKKRQEWNTFA